MLWLGVALLSLGARTATPLQVGAGDRALLPGVDFAVREPAAWLEEFEASEGGSRDVLWCLYRSLEGREVPEAVSASLRGWLARAPSDTVRRDLETVLTQWGVDYELAPQETLPGAGPEPAISLDEFFKLTGIERASVFVVPLADPTASQRELLESLASNDARLQVGAALELGRRGEQVGHLVQRLIHAMVAAGDLEWSTGESLLIGDGETRRLAVPIEDARHLAVRSLLSSVGTEVAEALLALASDTQLDEATRRCAWRPLSSPWRASWVEAFAHFEGGADPLGREFERNLLRILADPERARAAQTEPQPALGEALVEKLRTAWGADPSDAELVELTGQAGSWNARVRTELSAPLVAHLTQGDPLEGAALGWLARWGVASPEVRASYLRVLGSIDPLEPAALEHLPLLHEHDELTLEALRRLFDSAADKRPFLEPLISAGRLVAACEPLAQALLAALPVEDEGSWERAFRAGFQDTLDRDARAPLSVRPWRLGIAIRAAQGAGRSFESERGALLALLRARGADDDSRLAVVRVVDELHIAEGEFCDWGLDVLVSFWAGSSYLHEAVVHALRDVELSPGQRARLYHLDFPEWSDCAPQSDYLELLARQGPGALEWAGFLRRVAEKGYLEALDCALEIARFAPRDERILVRALEDPEPERLLRALELIAEHHLDTPRLRSAVLRAGEGANARVRKLAATVFL
jgi:hypothetical protein